MLKPSPSVLRGLLSRYADARITLSREDTPANRLELDNVSFTLCVATATTNVRDALAAADTLLLPSAAPAPRVRAVKAVKGVKAVKTPTTA
ncbi:DUF5133 domain-containing protein [Streptomyces subrutilus]|uniref:DUF5133 domain-containing protein n=1 Tax=Streptomyces subrutilus TaxID=36818 RepID=A0A918QFD4_9ACTN|nr:DUF5133 domain-containing protein [Streptomyces subrutilus]WSJ33680.1 DUF5133 domain-containing protein [Streptomyces subrutilus]GGZ45932.1 hypothetical protein GCM10010371_01220 [Streptomyces subrutilus]